MLSFFYSQELEIDDIETNKTLILFYIVLTIPDFKLNTWLPTN